MRTYKIEGISKMKFLQLIGTHCKNNIYVMKYRANLVPLTPIINTYAVYFKKWQVSSMYIYICVCVYVYAGDICLFYKQVDVHKCFRNSNNLKSSVLSCLTNSSIIKFLFDTLHLFKQELLINFNRPKSKSRNLYEYPNTHMNMYACKYLRKLYVCAIF